MKKAEINVQDVGWDAIPQSGIAAEPHRSMVALTMMVPADWKFQGGQMAGNTVDCNFTAGRLGFFAVSPDGKRSIFSVPATPASMWTNVPMLAQMVQQNNRQPYISKVETCNLEQPQPLAQKIGALARAVGQKIGSRSIEPTGPMQAMPGEATAKLAAVVQQANQRLAQQGAQLAAEMGRLPVHIVGGKDDPFDGYMNVLQVVRTQRMSNGGTVWITDYPMQVLTAASPGEYAQYDAMFATMLDTVWVSPEYQQVMAQLGTNMQSVVSQMMADNQRAAMQQMQIRQSVSDYASHVISNVNANRSAALDHSAQQFSLYMGDQAQYHDPSGGTVTLPGNYSHAWASDNGQYIVSDSPSYSPGAGWTEMQMVH
jgi:hypothetical protein